MCIRDRDYTVPREGSNIWYDGWVIPRYARNVKAASYFINYLCQPSVALRNMDAIGYVSAVATPEIREAKTDTTLDVHSDLSYFFGPLPGADSLQIDPCLLYTSGIAIHRHGGWADSRKQTD